MQELWAKLTHLYLNLGQREGTSGAPGQAHPTPNPGQREGTQKPHTGVLVNA